MQQLHVYNSYIRTVAQVDEILPPWLFLLAEGRQKETLENFLAELPETRTLAFGAELLQNPEKAASLLTRTPPQVQNW